MVQQIPAEKGATPTRVVPGLGYPNGRAEVSTQPTGWLASRTLADGSADQSGASISIVALALPSTADRG